MSSCTLCGKFYVPENYETDEGYCPECLYSSPSISYQDKEWSNDFVKGQYLVEDLDC